MEMTMVKKKPKVIQGVPVVKTGIVVEGIDMYTYRGTDAIKEAGVTYRSASEAFRDATYATAGWKPKTDLAEGLEWFSELFLFFFWIGIAITLPTVLVIWLFR
jgi:hypothetical protein